MFIVLQNEPPFSTGVVSVVVGPIFMLLVLLALAVCAQKGKLGAGLLGLLILFGVFGVAIRIAKPNSTWAKRHYPPNGEKMRVARLRFPESAISVSPERTSQGPADPTAKLAVLRDDHEVTQAELAAGKARPLEKSNKGRIGEGVAWYVVIASALWTAIAIVGGGETSWEGATYPWWLWAMVTAGATFWALQLRKRRRSRATGGDPAL